MGYNKALVRLLYFFFRLTIELEQLRGYLIPYVLCASERSSKKNQPVPTTSIFHYNAYAFVSTINCVETNFVSLCSFVNKMSSKVYYSNNIYCVPYSTVQWYLENGDGE